MKTRTSGCENNNFSSNSEVKEIINLYSKKLGITKSALIRLGVVLVASKLGKKEKNLAIKYIFRKS